MKRTFTKASFLTIFATLFCLAFSFGQTTITTNAVSGAPFCSGTSISVSFGSTGTFDAGNVFTAQLSDESGGFDNPIATASGTSPISLNIPLAAVNGAKYAVRVVASSPATTGVASASFVINNRPPAPYSGIYIPDFCVGDAPRALAAAGLPGSTIRWYALDGSELSTAPTPNTSFPRSPSSPYVYYTQTLNGCESAKGAISVGIWEIARTPSVVNPTVCQYSNPTSETLSKAVTSTAPSGLGGSFAWYDAATGGNFYQGAPTPATSTVGTQEYYVSQDYSMACPSPRVKVTLTVNPASSVPTFTNPTYAKGQTASALSATGTGIKWYESKNSSAPLASAPVPSTTSVGKTSYWVSQNTNGCESERAEVVVTVTDCTPPAKPTVSDKTYQIGEIASALTATGTDLKWYATLSSTTPLASAPTPLTSAVGVTKYYVSQTNATGCESERAEITVTVTACTPPAKPTVSNKTYEVGENAPVLTATGSNLKWYADATTTTALASAPKPLTSVAGITKYYVSQTNASGCESERAEIIVTVTACTPPAKPTVSNKTYQVGENAPALTATGSNLKWYADASTTTSSPSAPSPSTATVGTTKYYVSQTNASGCESERAEIIVTVIACTPPDKPKVSDKTYDIGENAPALTATGTNLKWYENASTTTPLPSAPKPVTTKAGVTSYYVTQTNAIGCESERAKIEVTVSCKEFAGPAVVTPIAICQSPTVASPLTATPAAGHKLLWYTTATGGTGSENAPVPATDEAKSYSYYVSQTNITSGCESARNPIIVNVREAAKPTVTPIEYCIGADANVLTPSGNTYKWYAAAEGGSPLASTFKPSTAKDGTTPYYVTQTTSYNSLVCESARVKVDVIVKPLPAAVTPLSAAFCQELTDKSYTFTTQPSNGNTLNWYITATGGTPTTATPTISLKEAKTTTYYVTQLSDKKCESAARVEQKVVVKPLPAAPGIAQPTIEYCQFVAAKPLEATPVKDGILNWFGTDASGGTSSPNAPTPSTAEGGTTSYYVGQTLAGCASTPAKIDVKINTTPKPTTKTFLEYCQNATAPALDATGTVLKWYRGANDTEFQGIPFVPFTEKVQDYSFYVTQTGANGCESPKEEIKIHIKSLPSATISGSSTIDLGQTTNITIRFTGDGPWTYVLSNGTTATTDQANHQVEVKPTTTTSYLVTEVSNACGKGLPIGSATVTVKVPTINSGNPSVSEICAGKAFVVPFQQSGDFPAGNAFKLQVATENSDAKFYTIPSTATSNSVSATFPDTTKGGTFYVRVISVGATPDFTVKGSVSSITINASPLPVATLTGAQTILVGDKAELKADITGKAPWTFTLNNGTKDSLITANATPYVFKLAPKTTTTYAITKVTNGCGIGTGVGTARVQVDPILGVEPPAPANWAKVYPTVINGQVTVEVTGTISPKQATIEIVDLNGRTHSTQKIKQKTTQIDFTREPSGLYLIRIQNGTLNTVQRVMKP